MKTLTRNEFEELLEQNPGKKFAFFESTCNENYEPGLHVTLGDKECPSFGADAIELLPIIDDFIYSYDWNLKEYFEEDIFVILENDDLDKLINLLTSAIN